MIDVMRAIAAATAIQTPAFIDCADAQLCGVSPAVGFSIGDSLAGVLRDFPSGL